MTTKLEGGGDTALVAGQLKKDFFAADPDLTHGSGSTPCMVDFDSDPLQPDPQLWVDRYRSLVSMIV